MQPKYFRGRQVRYSKLLVLGGVVCQLIPFGCGQGILRLVTPVFLDDTVGLLDGIVTAVAPLVLP